MSPPPPPPSTKRTKKVATLNSLRSYMKTLGSQRLLTKSRSIASQFGLGRRVGVVKQPTKGWQWQSCKLRWSDLQVWKNRTIVKKLSGDGKVICKKIIGDCKERRYRWFLSLHGGVVIILQSWLLPPHSKIHTWDKIQIQMQVKTLHKERILKRHVL